MKVEMRNSTTIIVSPENTAEMVALQGFAQAKVSVEKPQPFTSNVEVLKVEKE